MKIISIHNGHDASVTAIENGKVIYHWELERHFNRVKHFAGFHNKNIVAEFLKCHALPLLNWKTDEIDYISLSSLYAGWVGDCYENTEFPVNQKYSNSLEQPYILWQAEWDKNKSQKFFASTHHVNHMAYSYYTSPYDQALLFAYDGEGDFNTSSTYGIGVGNKLKYLGNLTTHPRSDITDNRIGIAFNRLGQILPFLGKDFMATPGKAMGYSSYGKARNEWKNEILNCITKGSSKVEILLEKFNLPSNMNSYDERAMDLMATIQKVCEEYVLESTKKLIKETEVKNLCLSGGCALNVLINERIKNEITDNIYVPPACSDTGQSIGSGLYLWHHVLNKNYIPTTWHNPYLGDYLQDTRVLDKAIKRTRFESENELIEKATELLIDGKIIGWAQGRSEIGPRALGNRSILCFPKYPNMKDIINKKVKHREWWRPFAPVCLFEDFQDWFETKQESPYMLFSPQVKPEKRHLIPSITHIDGSARLQTIKKYQNPLLYSLIYKIKQRTDIPIILNTSLNDKGKPIANNITSIYDLLKNTDLDCVFIGMEMLTKRKWFV
jgi:carbamoyltransferase